VQMAAEADEVLLALQVALPTAKNRASSRNS
jgi:hypothetical protein